MSLKNPPPIDIEESEVELLIEQAQQGVLDAAAQKRIVPLLRTLIWLQRTLFETRISLSKLKKILFGKRTEKTHRKPKDPPDEPADDGRKADEDVHAGKDTDGIAADQRKDASETDQTETGSGDRQPRGHGRLGVADYPGAEHVCCPHDRYQKGDSCPECLGGRLYPSRPLMRLRFAGQPLAKVTHYELEQLRCGTCGELFPAQLPPEAGQETYHVSLKVNLAIAHYHLGLPFKRIESFQQMLGMPLPDATQWELVEQVADSGYRIYEQLKQLGAQQPLVYQDDTGARILSMIQENQADPPPRTQGHVHHSLAIRRGTPDLPVLHRSLPRRRKSR